MEYVMREITVTTKVYKFNELSKKAKDRAIVEHIQFWIETIPYEEMAGNLKKAVNEAERLQTPWFTHEIVYDYCKDEVIDEIKLNDYDFTIEGNIY